MGDVISYRVASKRNTINANYTLHNHQLEIVDSSKYLGVTTHINNIPARANRTLGFIKRNLRGCKSSARARAYESVVRHAADSIWDPHNI